MAFNRRLPAMRKRLSIRFWGRLLRLGSESTGKRARHSDRTGRRVARLGGTGADINIVFSVRVDSSHPILGCERGRGLHPLRVRDAATVRTLGKTMRRGGDGSLDPLLPCRSVAHPGS